MIFVNNCLGRADERLLILVRPGASPEHQVGLPCPHRRPPRPRCDQRSASYRPRPPPVAPSQTPFPCTLLGRSKGRVHHPLGGIVSACAWPSAWPVAGHRRPAGQSPKQIRGGIDVAHPSLFKRFQMANVALSSCRTPRHRQNKSSSKKAQAKLFTWPAAKMNFEESFAPVSYCQPHAP